MVREVLLRRPVLHELHGCEQSLAASDVAGVRVIAECRRQACPQPLTHLRRVFPQPLALHDLDVLHRDGAAGRMARVRIGVHPAVVGLDRVHHVLDRAGDHDSAEWQITGGDALGEGQDVRLHVPV